MMIDTRTETAAGAVAYRDPLAPTAKWFKFHTDIISRPRPLIPIDGDLIAMTLRELLHFHDGEKDPEYFEQSLPNDDSRQLFFRDIALTDKGLLVLTDDSLYLIPGIVENKSSPIPAVSISGDSLKTHSQ